jgi:choline-glycine betaine transporter
MLLVGGADALSGLQTITIVAALPFVVVMGGLAVALVKDLRKDPLMVRRQYGEVAVASAVIAGVTEHGDDFALSVECAHARAERAAKVQPNAGDARTDVEFPVTAEPSADQQLAPLDARSTEQQGADRFGS